MTNAWQLPWQASSSAARLAYWSAFALGNRAPRR
jgi:hypothetical protein